MSPENTADPAACQSGLLTESSSAIPKPQALIYNARMHLRQHGLVQTAAKIAHYLQAATSKRLGRAAKRSPVEPITAVQYVLGLQAGEIVEVKTELEIQATLDIHGACAGLQFLPDMGRYCGKRYVVLKRVERIYLEESGRTRRLKNTVLLRDVMCDGMYKGCDRSCFFYWREAWLRRPPSSQGVG